MSGPFGPLWGLSPSASRIQGIEQSLASLANNSRTPSPPSDKAAVASSTPIQGQNARWPHGAASPGVESTESAWQIAIRPSMEVAEHSLDDAAALSRFGFFLCKGQCVSEVLHQAEGRAGRSGRGPCKAERRTHRDAGGETHSHDSTVWACTAETSCPALLVAEVSTRCGRSTNRWRCRYATHFPQHRTSPTGGRHG